MAVIVRAGQARARWWREHLQALLPDLPVHLWDDPVDPAEIEFAVVWRPPPGGLKRFPNLRCIISMGAGIDHVLVDPELPQDLPIIRTTSRDLSQRMREYVCLHVLRLHRRLPELEEGQRLRQWRQEVNPPADQRRVGLMGLGNLGADCARTLAVIGFDVAGWSRRPKAIDGVTSHTDLTAFLKRTEILVCLLPLTEATRGILCADLFAQLPRGASVINAARGGHLIEAGLLEALDSGQIEHATLDVFDQEPLPADHPFWTHPRILVTPHVASLIDPVAGGQTIAANIRRFLAGEPISDLVDLSQGY